MLRKLEAAVWGRESSSRGLEKMNSRVNVGQDGPPHPTPEFLGCFASLGCSDKLPPTAPQSRLGSSWGCGGWQGAGMEPSDHVHVPQSYSTWSHRCCAGIRRAVWGPWGFDRRCPGLHGSLCDTQGGHVHVPTWGSSRLKGAPRMPAALKRAQNDRWEATVLIEVGLRDLL